jgi:hypothetical protein
LSAVLTSRRRKHGRGAGERRQWRHRHKLRPPFLERSRPEQVHQQRRADEGGDDNGNAENDDAKIHFALQARHTRDRPAYPCGSAAWRSIAILVNRKRSMDYRVNNSRRPRAYCPAMTKYEGGKVARSLRCASPLGDAN